MNHALRVGAVNWDAAIPTTEYFGHYTSLTLSEPQFRWRAPYFSEWTNNRFEFPPRTAADYDREFQYAIDAGIDYFAYCWYTDTKIEQPKTDFEREAGWAGLGITRRAHMVSSLRNKLKLCAILRPSKMNDADFVTLARASQEDYFECVENRPLIYLFTDYPEGRAAVTRLNALIEALHGRKPFFVLQETENYDPSLDYAWIDAFSAYACGTGSHQAADFYEVLIRQNEERKRYHKPVLPLFSMGWNPSPRKVNRNPWTNYGDLPYKTLNQPEEFLLGARMLRQWMDENRAEIVSDHLLTFAWNEFEEGGWICPTRGADGTPDTTHLDAFRACVACWHR